MKDDNLPWLPATEVAALIRDRRLSAVDYIDSILTRIAQWQPAVNCFATITDAEARAAAAALDERLRRGEPVGPLAGVAVNIKDLFDTAGVRTAHGSAVFEHHVPARDNVLVQRLKDAGAIMVGKSTTPEFGHKGITDSPVFGITRNPWNTAFGAGGSSGGAAAAVAAGLGQLGLGTDGAGSIRIPAATCGVVGLKPTLGLVPFEQAGDAFANYGYAGPMTRTAADAALMMQVIQGPAASDPWTRQHETLDFTLSVPRSLDGLRIGHFARMANAAVDPEVAAATARMLALLREQGAIVEDCQDAIDWADAPGRIVYMAGQAASYGPYEAEFGERMDASIRRFIAEGRSHSAVELRQAQFARTRLYRAVEALFSRYDLLVSPSLPTPGLPADFQVGVDRVTIGDWSTTSTRQAWSAFVYPFNLTGHPALTLPAGFASSGLPLGVQLVGRWWSDPALLGVGAVIERQAPWAHRRPAAAGA
jgi:Asp-tRNA(Asn)/Glu-tRNA(Gln) amidotransferase A subunit family amidase